jgi:glyoxylase-like metal-dependent hydrolase (beta-lactamase superfamily II)
MNKLIIKLLVVILLIPTQYKSFAQSSNKTQKYHIKKVNENVYIFTEIWKYNSNANSGIVIGDDGVLIINTLMLSSAKDLEIEIKKITDKPITYVMNSDSDVFNYHANKYFSDKGAKIISHENLKYATTFTDMLFSTSISFKFGGEIITVYHTKAHTLDHIDIHLKNSNIIFMGDGFKGYWLTYVGPGGTKGVVQGINKALEIADNNTIIVSGNTSKKEQNFLNDKTDLEKLKNIHLKFSKRVGQLHKLGKNIQEISEDDKIHEILKPLELYPKVKNNLTAFIAHIIEVDYTQEFKLKNHQLEDYVGTYTFNKKSTIKVTLKDNKLYASEKGNFIFELKAINESDFDFNGNTGFRGTSNREDYLHFQFDKNGKVKSLTPKLKTGNWWINVITSGKYTKIKSY